jgi:hypothetical protein
MAHYAKVNNGIVEQVIVAEPEFFKSFVDSTPGEWIQTSYNTRGNQHLLGGTPLRGNYAGIGHIYDRVNDVFYQPKPFPSWTMNQSTWLWEAPVAMPTDTENSYSWNESTQSWDATAIPSAE